MNEDDHTNNLKLTSVWVAFFTFLLAITSFFCAKENFSFFDVSFSVNGVSICMIAATTFLILIGVIIGCDEIKNNRRQFHVLVLLLESLLIMLFSTIDILVFYILFELILLVAFVLLGVSSKDSICASKFFIILSIGAIFLFCGIAYLIEITGITEINILAKYTFTSEQKKIIFTTFFIGFAGQMALFPLHIWLPDSHTKPPVAVSIVFAGALLKIGAFGMITILLPLTKNINFLVQKYIFITAIITIGYATLAAIVQRDFKRMISYISIIHMAIISMGIFSYTTNGILGAFFNLVAHGFIVSTLLVIIYIINSRRKQRSAEGFSLAIPLNFSSMALAPTLAIISAPFLPYFVGNFLIITGTFQRHTILSSILCVFIVCSILYGLKIYHQIFWGENNQKKAKLRPIECLCLYPLVVCTLVMGVIPNKILIFAKEELCKICGGEVS
jgi:NADH-quinone oxidoreductase subunit M